MIGESPQVVIYRIKEGLKTKDVKNLRGLGSAFKEVI